MNTEMKSVEQKNFEQFLTACQNIADDVDCIVGNLGFDDMAHNGPGQVKFYVRLWREAGKPSDSLLGTSGLERGLEYSKMLLKLMGDDGSELQARLTSLAAQAREYVNNSN